MNLKITFKTPSRQLQRDMLEFFKNDQFVRVNEGTKRIGNKREFSIIFCFYERKELDRFIFNHGPNNYALIGFEDVLGSNYILIDKKDNKGICGDYQIELSENDLEYRAFHNYSDTNVLKTIKIWEKWDDLLLRLPKSTQHDIFVNSLCNMCHFEIVEVLNGEKEFVDQFPEQEKFIAYMIDNGFVNKQAINEYMKARDLVSIHINKV